MAESGAQKTRNLAAKRATAGPSPLRAWLAHARAADVLTVGVLAFACIAVAMPMLTAQWLPFVDYPQHLGTIAAIHGMGDSRFDPYFVVDYSRSQYLLLYVLGDWLAYPLGAEGAARLTAVLSVASLPLAVALWLREHGRPAMLGAIASGVALHVWVFWGFLNYAAGMSAALLAAAAMARLARAPTRTNAALLALAALLTFYAHAQLFAWMGIACVVTLAAMAPHLGRRRTLRALGLGLLAALPSIAATAVWLHNSGVIERGEAGSRSGHAAQVAASGGGPQFAAVHETLRHFLEHSFDAYQDGTGVRIAIAFFSVALFAALLRGHAGRRASASKPAAPPLASPPLTSPPLTSPPLIEDQPLPGPPHTLAPELILLASFALYLFAPFSYRLIEPINHRFLPMALALLPVLGPRALPSWPARGALAIASLALALYTAQSHADRFTETDREMGDLSEALAETEGGSRLLGLIHDPQSGVVSLPIYLHAHQYYQARAGGLACFSFVEFPKSPVQYAAGAAPPPFPPRFEWTPQRYDHATWGDAFDYWLVRHAPGRPPPRIFRGAAPSGAPTPVPAYEGDRWTLYRLP